MSEAIQIYTLATDEILRGWARIAEVAGVDSEGAFWRLVARGMPVTRVGKQVSTTRNAVIEWVRRDAERRGSERAIENAAKVAGHAEA